jgi:K+-sensing histidine kinase KdpD
MSDELKRTLADVIARLAHDVKNPLAVIVSNLRFIESQLHDTDMREAADESIVSAERLSRMLEDVTDLHRLGTEEFQAEHREGTLDEIEQHVRNALRHQLGSRTLSFSMGDGRYVGDIRLIGRIIVNIVEHGLRRTPSRGSVVVVGKIGEAGLEIEVDDGGTPFSPDRTPSILADEFPKAQPPMKGYRSDQGLGLFFAGRAAVALGATVTVGERQSEKQGVRFQLLFPERA